MDRKLSRVDADRILTSAPRTAADPDRDTLGRFLDALEPPADAAEISDDDPRVVAIARAIVEAPTSIEAAQRRRVGAPAGRVATIAAAAAVLALSTTAAAATGSLPASAQRAAARVFSYVNITIPSPEDHPTGPTTHPEPRPDNAGTRPHAPGSRPVSSEPSTIVTTPAPPSTSTTRPSTPGGTPPSTTPAKDPHGDPTASSAPSPPGRPGRRAVIRAGAVPPMLARP